MNENLSPNNSVEDTSDNVVNEKIVEVNTEIEESTKETEKQEDVSSLSQDELVGKLKDIAMMDQVPSRAEVDIYKQAYFRLRTTEVEQEKEAFAEGEENDIKDFAPSVNPSDDVVKTYLDKIKEKRAKQIADEERVREDNYKKKLTIIDKIKELTESTDDFNKLFNEFKDLQHQWNAIKLIPQAKERDLWTAYQVQSELFYDLVKINNELRDYDFKKNLDRKTKICELAEKLVEEEDRVSAFHQLQNFHKQWREIGPVAKELREDLWSRFKAASTEVNRNYQGHFESLKDQEEENLEKKNAICEELKAIDYSTLDSFKSWNEMTKKVIEIQTTWRTIGFVPRKYNNKIFEEFRSLCDDFFSKKSEFFKGAKDERDENLEKKQELCNRANALKDSVDWRKTTKEMVAIQKEWKTIGPVPRKYSDAIWKEFVGACDHFFEKKKESEKGNKEEERENLVAKTEIVEQVTSIDTNLPEPEQAKLLRELSDKWHKIGFVPFKEKDKCYETFHQALDTQYDRLKIDKDERRMENFKSNMKQLSKQDNADRALSKERDHLMFKYNRIKSDLQTYETNMAFLSVSSKGANTLLKDVNKQIDSLRNEMELVTQQIEAIDTKLDEI